MNVEELYQEVILDHNKSPHNYREMAEPSRMALGHNPLCGDRLKLYVKLDGDIASTDGTDATEVAADPAAAPTDPPKPGRAGVLGLGLALCCLVAAGGAFWYATRLPPPAPPSLVVLACSIASTRPEPRWSWPPTTAASSTRCAGG